LKTLLWLIACAIVGGTIAWPTGAHAQIRSSAALSPPGSVQLESIPSVTLAAAVDAAWRRALVAREAEGLRARADADRQSAARPWAQPPALELRHRDDRVQTSAGQRETEVGISWPIWLPGQRAATVTAAEATAAYADASQHSARLVIAGEVRIAAWHAIAQVAELAQVDAQVDVLQRLVDDVERRVRAGDLARADALAARGEMLAAQAHRLEVRQRVHAAQIQWTQLTGLEGLPSAADVSESGANHGEGRMDRHPDLLKAASLTEQARRRLELVSVSRRDAPELLVGVRHEVPDRGGSAQNSLAVGIRLPFATEDRNRPLLVAAAADLDVAQTAQARLRERIAADIATARSAVDATDLAHQAESDRARLLRERASLIDRSFRAGETPLPELLRALAAAGQAESSAVRHLASVGLARARLHQASGDLP
jgi:cobalt-zinc-cadmium efflux system outer membrane protein